MHQHPTGNMASTGNETNWESKDYYELLGVCGDASAEEIKKA